MGYNYRYLRHMDITEFYIQLGILKSIINKMQRTAIPHLPLYKLIDLTLDEIEFVIYDEEYKEKYGKLPDTNDFKIYYSNMMR